MKAAGILCCLVLCPAFCLADAPSDKIHRIPEAFSKKGEGIDSVALLPPPPAAGSVQFLLDESLYVEGLLARGSERASQAAKDADLTTLAESFSPAFGLNISETDTPVIYGLLARASKDLGGRSTRAAKKHYQRLRPYVLHHDPTCLPQHEELVWKNGSYPSGHSSRGWGMALILAEINPQNKEAILRRGYEIGQSRVICGYHWQSDVDAGRIVASAAVAFLHSNEEFLAAMKQAKAEFLEKTR